MNDAYLFIPIKRGLCTYKDVFIDKIYSIEDLDLMWQMINMDSVVDMWTAINSEPR